MTYLLTDEYLRRYRFVLGIWCKLHTFVGALKLIFIHAVLFLKLLWKLRKIFVSLFSRFRFIIWFIIFKGCWRCFLRVYCWTFCYLRIIFWFWTIKQLVWLSLRITNQYLEAFLVRIDNRRISQGRTLAESLVAGGKAVFFNVIFLDPYNY